METRLSRICDALIEAGWLAALIVTPLFFNTFSNRVFEPDKLHLLRSIALVMAVVWIVQLLDAGVRGRARLGPDGAPSTFWGVIRRTPLVLPTLILVGAYLVSTALSVVPRISFFGSYVRMQGAYTFISYVLIFFMVATHLRSRVQLNRILHAVILTSLPIAIYGIIQHYGLDALPWGGDTRERVAANMGNAIFVAAYLIMALFLTLERLIDSVASLLNEEKGTTGDALRAGAYLFILAVQIIAIVFTQSRGPWLGLAAGFYVFGLLGVLLLGRWAVGRPRAPRWLTKAIRPVWLSIIALTVAGAAFLVVFNLPNSPFVGLRQTRFIGRLGTLASTTEGTNAVRVLIWEGVVDMMLKPHPPIQQPNGASDTWNIIRPLVGYGPESMWVAYNRFYPPDLAHYEARNASPDRSHNETFDTLVRTGLIGFGVQLWVYVSIFYYSLRWLGLMEGRRQRNLFLGFLGGGALLGVIVPALTDGSLRLAGIGLPAGLIIGLVFYVTVDLWLTPPTAAAPETTPADGASGGGRRQLLILALFAAVIAHFVEIHFGIAIASTLTTFWALAGVLVAVGLGWVNVAGEQPAAETAQTGELAAPAHKSEAPAPVIAAHAPTPASAARSKSRAKAQTPAGKPAAASTTRRPAERAPVMGRPAPQPSSRPRSPGLTFLPYAGIGALITLVLTWDYLINQTGAQGASNILWNAFTTRIDNTTFRIVQSPMLLMLMVFTWLVGGLLALTEHLQIGPARRGTAAHVASRAAVYAGVVIGVWLIYGLFHAGRLSVQGFSGLAVFNHVASHILVFDIVLFIGMLFVGAAIWAGDTRPRPARFSQDLPAIPLVAGAGAALVALVVIVNVNIKTVQADTYYKQGLAYEGAGAWDGAVVLHGEAAKLEPAEDFYYLFLGRALLQLAAGQPVGNAVLPTDTAKLSQTELLSVIERGVRARNREDLMRASYAALSGAQRLNPYNTDHSANLARHNRSWAFTDALGPNDAPTNALLRQLATTQAKGVNFARLNQSLAYYRQATSLSPQNAQLWNELATTQFIMGETDVALATLKHSETLDPIYNQTFIIRGDMLATIGDKAGALEAYRKGVDLAGADPGILSAVGVYSAQTGDNEGALVAFKRMAEVQEASLAATQQQLNDHNALVSRLGGYGGLLPTASQRRDALQGSLSGIRSQLHLTYRNLALVQRDAGRIPEAMQMARTALTYASEAERPTIDALIAELQKRSGG
jgi:tetratricopeptide (TPR) repeat protein